MAPIKTNQSARANTAQRVKAFFYQALGADPEYKSGAYDKDGRISDEDADLDVIAEERKWIGKWLEKTGAKDDKNLVGLALSGGGIRSATFSLGVLQALARHGILKRVDYLSTVSGGGYIGAGLTWWLSGKTGSSQTYGLDGKTFPYGTDDPTHPDGTPAAPALAYLRNNGNYLVPGAGIGYLAGVAITIRAVFLNLLVWIPIAAAIFAMMIWLGPWVGAGIDWISDHWKLPLNQLPNPIAVIEQTARLALQKEALRTQGTTLAPEVDSLQLFHLLFWLGLGAIGWYLIACVDFAIFTFFAPLFDDRQNTQAKRAASEKFNDGYVYEKWIARVAGPALFLAAIGTLLLLFQSKFARLLDLSQWDSALSVLSVLLTLIFLVFLQAFAWLVRFFWRVNNLPFIYGTRRFFERFYGVILLIGIGLLVVGSIPLFVTFINLKAAGGAGIASVLLGAISGVWGHLRLASNQLGPFGAKVVLPLGSVLLFFGIAILAYLLAVYWRSQDGWIWIGITSVFVVAVLSCFFTNINYISPHQYYRDRLAEAFMPDIERVETGAPGAAKRSDCLNLSEAWDNDDPKGPYPIINANIVLVNSINHKIRFRGGDSFMLTPLFCGSNATGWTRTKKFTRSELKLATAMAISGAAANPNTGVGGKGITRNRFVSAVMTLLNLRLGFWARKPVRDGSVFRQPDHFHPGLTFTIPGYGHTEARNFIELSDGGHFENLGIYELVRRGCRLIIVCDGGQDIQASYSDFVTAVRRIEQDIGAEIEFLNGGPEQMIARPVNNDYPKDADYAPRGFLWAKVKYHRHKSRGGPAEGLLVYLKTTMITELGIKAKGYKGAQPEFPDQSTGDQFFDEEQFEAYREVGFRIADSVCRDTQLKLKAHIRRIKA